MRFGSGRSAFRGIVSVSVLLSAGLPVLFVLVILAATAVAQTAGGVIRGTVHDPSGAAIVGASISLLDAARQPVASTSSDSSGSFHFSNLKPGNYIVVGKQDGFAAAEAPATVDSLAPAVVSLKLAIAAVSSEVTVGEQATEVSTEVAENQNVAALDQTELDQLPVFDQDYITMLSEFLSSDDLSTNGTTLVVNGVEANGPGVTASAIQSVKINNNPYSALYSRPGRARLEVTTKAGTDQIHGTFNYLFRNSVFDASNAFAAAKPPEDRQYFEGSLSGPIGNGRKTSYLLSGNYDILDLQSVVYAYTAQGQVNENIANPSRHMFFSGRVFHDYGEANQLWMGYSYERRTAQNQGVGGTTLPEAGYSTEFQEHEFNLSDSKVYSSKWMNQIHFLAGHYDQPTVSNMAAPNIVVQGAFKGGGAQADARNTEYHVSGNDTVTYSSGKHELKFGVDVPDISRRGRDDFTNQIGAYSFASIAAYLANRPESVVIQQGNGHTVFIEKVLGAFIEDTMRLRPGLSITLGVRYYWQNYFHDDSNNFAPRLGFAWSPWDSKTVVRGGAGVFYDRTGPGAIADLLHFNGVNLRRYIIDNPAFPVVGPSAYPTSIVTLAPNAKIPYTVQWSVGLERQVSKKSTFSAQWVSSRGIDLFRSLDTNAPLPPDFSVRPDPLFGQVRTIESNGRQVVNAMELSYRGNVTHWFSGQIQYRLSKSYNNTSGIWWFPENSFDPNSDWSRSDWDRRHRFNLMGTFDLPRAMRFGIVSNIYSGQPYTELTGFDNNNDGQINDRPIGVPRNSLHGPGYTVVDMRLSRDFKFAKLRKDGVLMTAGISAFNVFNNTNAVSYIGTLTSPYFGQAVAAKPPRRMQLNLEFKF